MILFVGLLFFYCLVLVWCVLGGFFCWWSFWQVSMFCLGVVCVTDIVCGRSKGMPPSFLFCISQYLWLCLGLGVRVWVLVFCLLCLGLCFFGGWCCVGFLLCVFDWGF